MPSLESPSPTHLITAPFTPQEASPPARAACWGGAAPSGEANALLVLGHEQGSVAAVEPVEVWMFEGLV
ncbi:MAG: hypothetical protein ACKOD9_20930 [Rubrivivax sp.]